jgi:hypothetical protein
VKARPGPILGEFGQTMLDRVDMDVVEVHLEVTCILNCVLPKSSLPHAAQPS